MKTLVHDFIVIVILASVLFVLRIYYLVKKHTRGTGLGTGLAGGQESEASHETRKKRYIRGASQENREAAEKALKKANKTRFGWRWMRLMDQYDNETYKAKENEKFAKANADKAERSHGIRKAGTERGRKL